MYISYKYNSYWTRNSHDLGNIKVGVSNFPMHLIIWLQWSAQSNNGELLHMFKNTIAVVRHDKNEK